MFVQHPAQGDNGCRHVVTIDLNDDPMPG